ncbi:DUF2625 family protein [Streptomyces sp. NPDC008238]
MRQIDELTDVDAPAWPELETMLTAAPVPVRVLPADPGEGRRCLLQLQVTARSALGALVLNTGGLLLDDGWVRVFGGGGTGEGGLPSLGRANRFPAAFDPAWHPGTGLVVGQDVLGGVFALNGHDPAAVGRPGAPGRMTYFAPDTLAWEAMDMGYAEWVAWLLSGRTAMFYEGLRPPAWREEAAALAPSQGLAVYPFLWSEEAHADLAATTRTAVPMRELVGAAADFARRTGPADPGFLGEV